MRIFKQLFIVVFLGCLSPLGAQDFHNSFFQFAPATINPALTGAFYGNLRVNAIGRDESRISNNSNGFTDLTLAADYNIDFGLTDDDWISVGGVFSRSNSAGAGDFRRQVSGLMGAYHLAFGKKSDKVFTVGFRWGSYSTGFRNPRNDDYVDPFELATGTASIDKNTFLTSVFNSIDPAQKSVTSYMGGIMLDAPISKTADIRIGFAMDHIGSPRLAVSGSPMDTMNIVPRSVEDLETRINAFVFLYTDLNKKLTFNPNILFQRQGVTTNLVLQALFNYVYNEEKQISFIFGAGARVVNDLDIPLYLGLDLKDLRVGLSYDTNVGGLTQASSTFGALELGVTKIFNWKKKPEVKPVFICPRL